MTTTCDHPLARLSMKADLEAEEGGYCETCSFYYAVATIHVRCDCGYATSRKISELDYEEHAKWHGFVVAQSLHGDSTDPK